MRQTRRRSRAGWSYIAGEKAKNRVRVYERPDLGLWLDYRDEQGKRVRCSLGTNDRETAKAKADEVAAAFRRSEKRRPAELNLAALFDNYIREVTPTKGKTSRGHDGRTVEMLVRAFGAHRKPESLSVRDWNFYITERTAGRLVPKGKKKGVPARPRTVQQDLRLLLAVLNWATRYRPDDRSDFLLDKNPLRGLKPPKEENPKRAIVTDAQYAQLIAVSRDSDQHELLLVVVAETGHRIKSVRQLRWSDIDLDGARVRWRAENDKIGLLHVTPLTEAAVVALRDAQARSLAIGDAWVFPSPRDPSRCLSEDSANHIFQRLARKAGLPKGQRFGWHSLRRRMATSIRGGDPKTILALGGWKSWMTVLTCYQVADEDGQRDLLAKRLPVGPKVVNSSE